MVDGHSLAPRSSSSNLNDGVPILAGHKSRTKPPSVERMLKPLRGWSPRPAPSGQPQISPVPSPGPRQSHACCRTGTRRRVGRNRSRHRWSLATRYVGDQERPCAQHCTSGLGLTVRRVPGSLSVRWISGSGITPPLTPVAQVTALCRGSIQAGRQRRSVGVVLAGLRARTCSCASERGRWREPRARACS